MSEGRPIDAQNAWYDANGCPIVPRFSGANHSSACTAPVGNPRPTASPRSMSWLPAHTTNLFHPETEPREQCPQPYGRLLVVCGLPTPPHVARYHHDMRAPLVVEPDEGLGEGAQDERAPGEGRFLPHAAGLDTEVEVGEVEDVDDGFHERHGLGVGRR